MTFLEKSMDNLPEDVKAEVDGKVELSMDDLDAAAGGTEAVASDYPNDPYKCKSCGSTKNLHHTRWGWFCSLCAATG